MLLPQESLRWSTGVLFLQEARAGVLFLHIACGCAAAVQEMDAVPALLLWLLVPCAGVPCPKSCMYVCWNAAAAVTTAA
jgi:hypothetical protein